MNLIKAKEGEEYIIKEILTDDEELTSFLFSSWLERLGVDPDIAAQDACRIEHVISSESFEALKKHIK